MDRIWGDLQAVTIRINAEVSPYESDRANAKKLDESHIEGGWKTFYEGIDALERGCGYSDYSALAELCRTAAFQDDRRLLHVIEQKTKLFDVVLFLRCVDPAIKLAWINGGSFTRTPALFECLRQALEDVEQDGPELNTITKGLLRLQQESSEHFQYLFSRNILYRENMTRLVSKLLVSLPKSGWSTLSQCVSFDDVTQDHIRFWDQCTMELDWDMISSQAGPLLEAWGSYMAQSLSGHYRQSLYCDVSNILIHVLVCKLELFEQYLSAMGKVVHAGEAAMYHWYEQETQQFGALITCLSIIEHLRYVWLNNSAAYAKPFPEELRFRCSRLISQWRYLWVSCGKSTTKEEIVKLENWLKCASITICQCPKLFI